MDIVSGWRPLARLPFSGRDLSLTSGRYREGTQTFARNPMGPTPIEVRRRGSTSTEDNRSCPATTMKHLDSVFLTSNVEVALNYSFGLRRAAEDEFAQLQTLGMSAHRCSTRKRNETSAAVHVRLSDLLTDLNDHAAETHRFRAFLAVAELTTLDHVAAPAAHETVACRYLIHARAPRAPDGLRRHRVEGYR